MPAAISPLLQSSVRANVKSPGNTERIRSASAGGRDAQPSAGRSMRLLNATPRNSGYRWTNPQLTVIGVICAPARISFIRSEPLGLQLDAASEIEPRPGSDEFAVDLEDEPDMRIATDAALN